MDIALTWWMRASPGVWEIATVTTVHGFTGGDWKNRVYERLQRRAFRRFDAVVAVSHPLGESLARGRGAADASPRHPERLGWCRDLPRPPGCASCPRGS